MSTLLSSSAWVPVCLVFAGLSHFVRELQSKGWALQPAGEPSVANKTLTNMLAYTHTHALTHTYSFLASF